MESTCNRLAKYWRHTMKRKATKPYHIQRTTEGCDEVFLVCGPGSERPIVGVAFWEAEAEAFAVARRITAALNACEGIATEKWRKQ